jgi:hypothetical protein
MVKLCQLVHVVVIAVETTDVHGRGMSVIIVVNAKDTVMEHAILLNVAVMIKKIIML